MIARVANQLPTPKSQLPTTPNDQSPTTTNDPISKHSQRPISNHCQRSNLQALPNPHDPFPNNLDVTRLLIAALRTANKEIMGDGLELRLPRLDEEPEFLRAHRATTPEWPTFLHDYHDGMPFAQYLEGLEQQATGKYLPPGHVPSTFLFAFDGPRIVGRVAIRHALNDFLLRVGGHVGYVVVPEFRRQGYATAILRHALEIARQRLGLTRVLATCDEDNIGSIRTIEKNGGVLENVVTGPDLNTPKRRYWIDTTTPSQG
jgi:predicted acetyltransferase